MKKDKPIYRKVKDNFGNVIEFMLNDVKYRIKNGNTYIVMDDGEEVIF